MHIASAATAQEKSMPVASAAWGIHLAKEFICNRLHRLPAS